MILTHRAHTIAAASYGAMLSQFEDSRMLDLTGSEFAQITDDGLMEIVHIAGVCANLVALFTNRANVSRGAIMALREQCGSLQCASLGQEITKDTFLQLQRGYGTGQIINLHGDNFSNLSTAGMLYFSLLHECLFA
jgi:hypothetical protein